MQCQQCGRTLSPANIAAGVCPSCGAAITAPPSSIATAEVAPIGTLRAAEASVLESDMVPTESLMLDVQPVLGDVNEVSAPAPSAPTVMQCPQCGRMLTAAQVAAGACPSCGFALAPVAAPPAPAPVAAAPIPAAVVPPLVAAVPVPASQVTAPAPVIVPPPAATPPPIARVFEEPPAPAQRNVGLVIALVVVVLIIVVLALLGLTKSGPFATIAATPTATATLIPTPTAVPTIVPPTPVAGFKAYLSPDGSFYISYPQGWAVSQQPVATTGTTVQLFSSTDRVDNLAAVPTGILLAPSQYALLLQQAVQSFNGTNPQFNPTPTTFTSGNSSWSKFTGTFDLQMVSQSAVALATTHDNATFVLVYFAPVTTFTSVDTSDYQTMVASFTFLR